MSSRVHESSITTLESAQPGEIIAFGSYPQTAVGADKTPIQWRVLRNSDGELFILSEYILDCKRYHGEYVDVTWRDCDLRKWLNDAFCDIAFNAAEQELIRTTLCTDNGDGCPDTEDRVFLLSTAEVRQLTDAPNENGITVSRRTIGTAFAGVRKPDGCHLYVYDKSVDKDYIVEDGEQHGCSWWWLRTQGNSPSRAHFIGTHSSIRSYCRVSRVNYGVRPALELRLH
ncbi:MAG: DUF6273 domain-containing protein [Anaerolineae bacterium]